jgi:ELWxxDGT repeat protein
MTYSKAVGLILALLATPVGAVTPVARLVKDLDTGSEPFHLFVSRPAMAGGKAFFTANTQEFGAELWVSSGAASGTERIADIYPGLRSSSPDQMMAMDGKMFFSADDGTHGRELWVSDGTPAGTIMVADVFPGSESSKPAPLATASGKLWFMAFTAQGPGLWCTDGTPANTIKLNATPPSGPAPALLRPSHFSVLDGSFIFASDNLIWKSDGTSEGTVVIEEIPLDAGFDQVNEMARIGDSVYYIVSSDFREWLWRTNGQAGGAVMIPKEPGLESWQVLRGLFPVGGKVSFFAQSELGDPLEWYCGDGTLDGSVRFDNQTFKRFNEESCLIGDIIYFGIENASRGGELYRSDGTLKGTYLVKDIRRGKAGAFPGNFQAAGKWLYFTADDGKKGREIWRTDGTSKGTRLVVETVRGRDSTDPGLLTADGESLYFRDTLTWPFGELWRTDGSKKGAVRLTVPEQKGLSGLNQALNFSPPIAALGDKVFFNARFSNFGIEPWTSDGTPAGTQPIGDTIKDGSADCQSMTRFGDRILYSGRSSAGNTQVWASNGSMAGTVQLTNFPLGNERNFPGNFSVDGDRMFFSSGRVDSALWVTDGTKRGTREIPMPGDVPFNIIEGTPRMVGPALFFAHDRRPDNHELWRSDGTPEGTVMLRGAFPLDEGSTRKPRLAHFTALGNSICFFSKTTDSARLWHSDGTAEGTLEVPVDSASGSFLQIATAVPFGDRFLFLAEARNSGLKWWISDGTNLGTRVLKDLSLTSPGFGSDLVREHALINGILYLGINTLAHGQELWRTDGSEEGTFMVADLFPGPVSSNPAGLKIHGNRLYFAATDPVHGRELWSSDGTAAGTGIVAEVMPGDRSSNPAMLCVAGQQLFFGAENPVAGFELHVLDLPEAGALSHVATGARSAGIDQGAGQGSSVVPDDESLLRLAFNLDPAAAGRPVLDAGLGTSGYPRFTRSSDVFRVEFLRRRDGRFSYVPKWSVTLAPGSFAPMTGPEAIVEISAEWERVTVEQVIAPGVTRMFGVVEVTEK